MGGAAGRVESFGSDALTSDPAGRSSMPPRTAIAPSGAACKRGRDFVSMKVERASSSPFKPMRE